MTRRWDALVVGSGPGGAVTARCLAEAGLAVLVVEEGTSVSDAAPPYSRQQMRDAYRGGGLTVALGRPSVAYAEARCLGGGSAVNSGFYHRPSAELLDGWSRAYAIDDLHLPALAEHLTAIEHALAITDTGRAPLSPSSDVLRRGAELLGWRGLDVPRWVSTGKTTIPNRRTMAVTYLPAAEAAGAEIWSRSRVEGVTTTVGRATGAIILRGTERLEVAADAVFVCGGAIQTPALLQRSGVRRHMGANLSVHPTVKVVAEFDAEVNDPADLPTFQVTEFAPAMTLGGSASRPSLIGLALADSGASDVDAMRSWRRKVVYGAAIQSIGSGRVRAVPGMRDPLVTYRLTREDGERLRSGLARLMHVLLAGGAVSIRPSYRGAARVHDRLTAADAVAAFTMAKASLMTVHLTGTAPMGEDRSRAAVDSYGRVHGFANLYANDASVLPWAPGINPQGTVMAVAQRNAAAFLRSGPRGDR